MRIDRIDVYHVSMPLVYPFRTAFGDDEVIESVLIRMASGSSFGWGESAPWRMPAYSAEYAAGAFDVIRRFAAPRLIGRDVSSGQQLQELLSPVKGNRFAKAALDLAWHDLSARMTGQPLYRLLGGSRCVVDVGADFGVMESLDALLAEVDQAVRQGFKRVKLKYRPGWELEMVREVRRAFPDLTCHVDCNSAYTLDALEMFRKLDRFGLAMIEQPLSHDDLIDHATLQREIDTPICLDESITSLAKARQALDVGACRWVNIKPGRVGGLTAAVAIHNHCRDRGVGCWVGGMLESAVGASHCIALATLDNFTYPNDIFPSRRFYQEDLAAEPIELAGPSVVAARDVPGCGSEPDPQRLAARTVTHVTL